jgi:hypothetical protein
MKNTIELKIGKKTYSLCYTIKALAALEKLIGKSVTYMFSIGSAGLVKQADIAFTVAGLVTGLNLKSEDEAYDLIEAYCEAGDDLDRMNAKIIEAILATGLFTLGTAPKADTVPKKPDKQKE